LPFYYNKYFRKALSVKQFGKESFGDLVDLVKDSVYLTDKKVIASQLEADMESLQIFVKLTEEARRERNLLIDMGEESAKLKVQAMAQPAKSQQGAKSVGPQKRALSRQSPWASCGHCLTLGCTSTRRTAVACLLSP